MYKGKVWTEERVAEVRKLTEEGYNSTEIAKKLGVTRNSIVSVWHRHDIKSRMALSPEELKKVREKRHPRFWTQEKLDRVQALLLQGKSMQVISDEFGVSHTTISRVAKKHDMKAVRKLGTNQYGEPGRKADRPLQVRDGQCYQERFAEGYYGQYSKVSISDHKDHQCRFPIDQADGSVRYCGDRVHESSVYCPAHHARCNTGFHAISKKRKARVAA